VYAWETDGTRRAGFPAAIDPALCDPSDESELHHRKCGFLASPAVAAHLEGPSGPVDIVAPALDGHVYAFRPDGSAVPHFPVELLDPSVAKADQMKAESINEPAIGDLDGDGYDDVVVASNESYGQSSSLNTDILSQVLAQAGGTSRLYAISGKTGQYLPGWPVKLAGAIQDTLPLIGPGHDAAIATIGGARRVIASTTGSIGIQEIAPDGSIANTVQQKAFGPASDATDQTGAINLFESAVVGDVLGTGTPAIVKYGLSLSDVVNLLLVGQNVPYDHLIEAFDATTTAPLPAWPRVTDDYQFLSSSTIAKVNPASPANQVIAGTGLGLLHAYDGVTGLDAPGFPKVTGGWLFAPAALSDDGRIAGITREGYLYEWNTDAPACQPAGAWESYRHDEHGSGDADTDGTPPGSAAGAKLEPAGDGRWTLTFTAPGDDRLCGTARAFTGSVDGAAVDVGATAAGGAKVTRTVTLPGDRGTLVLGATDEAGNRGIPARVPYDRTAAPTTGTPTPTPTSIATATATGTASPTATATPPPPCGDTAAPIARFTGVRATRHRVRLRGTARDRGCAGLLRVSATVKRRVGHRRCRVLHRSGRFGTVHPCARHHFYPAHGLRRWTLSITAPLPRGRYLASVRARDRASHLQLPRTARFRVR
jgi:hypothetical protein